MLRVLSVQGVVVWGVLMLRVLKEYQSPKNQEPRKARKAKNRRTGGCVAGVIAVLVVLGRSYVLHSVRV